MNEPVDGAGLKAVATLYNAAMTGLVLTLVGHRGAQAAADFVFAHFRRQHLEKFLPGLAKLGLDRLPHAVACAQYHCLSNALGGVKTAFMPETDRKAWVRYPPPRWIWQGAAICAIPASVNEAMLHGWHGHNGVSLDNPRLGFVCTGQTVLGDPGLEGYYLEHDRPLAPEERVRFAPGERAPAMDPALQPRLPAAEWPPARRLKVERAYAAEYVRSLLPVTHDLFGADEAGLLVGRTARLIGLQYQERIAVELGLREGSAEGFAALLHRLAAASGEQVESRRSGDAVEVVQTGWRLMAGVAVDPEWAFRAWNPLWEGMCAAHDRDLRLDSRFADGQIAWTVRPGQAFSG